MNLRIAAADQSQTPPPPPPPPPSPDLNNCPHHDLFSSNDLMIEIFRRLPIKSLVDMKFVSKNWNSLISHNLNSYSPAVGLFFPTSQRRQSMQLLIYPLPYPQIIHTQCTNRANKNNRKYYVCNLTTREYSALPRLVGRIRGLNLAFDPYKSPNYYKVVCVRELMQNRRYQFEVYSSETRGMWRKCGQPFAAQVNFKHGVYWNGAIHWVSITAKRKSIYFNPDDQMLLPKVMPMLPVIGGHFSMQNYYLGESFDHLHYIDVYKKAQFYVYEMRRDYSEWFIKYRVDISCVVGTDLFSISSLLRGKDSFLVLRIGGKFIRYNLVDRTFETICVCEDAMVQDHHPLTSPGAQFPMQYIESLCRV